MRDALAKLADWLDDKGVSLVSSNTYLYDTLTKEIHYRAGDPHQVRLAFLLHECGHVLCERSGSEKFEDGWFHPRSGKTRTKASAADLIYEELEAWNRGRSLARRLKIRVDDREFRRVYGGAIMSYFRCAAKKKL